MSKSFQEWAQQEIGRLRAEADALELTLKRYVTAAGAPSAQPARPASHIIRNVNGKFASKTPSAAPAAVTTKPGPKKQKGDAVLDFVKRAGPAGATIQDVHRFAAATLGMNNNSTRSMLWHLRQEELVERRDDGRFYYRPPSPIGAQQEKEAV